MAEQNKFLLVDLSVLPEVFTKVVEAKRYMAQGKAKSYSDAAKMAVEFPAAPFISIRIRYIPTRAIPSPGCSPLR